MSQDGGCWWPGAKIITTIVYHGWRMSRVPNVTNVVSHRALVGERQKWFCQTYVFSLTLEWCHNERNVVSNRQPHDCLLYIKAPRHWFCEGNSPVTCEFTAERASNAENVSIWWRHHVFQPICIVDENLTTVNWIEYDIFVLNIIFVTQMLKWILPTCDEISFFCLLASITYYFKITSPGCWSKAQINPMPINSIRQIYWPCSH